MLLPLGETARTRKTARRFARHFPKTIFCFRMYTAIHGFGQFESKYTEQNGYVTTSNFFIFIFVSGS